MNPYIEEAFSKFKYAPHSPFLLLYLYPFLSPPSREFFLRASTVDPPGVKLGIDEYSDVTMLAKPVVYISIKEICSTHSVRTVKGYGGGGGEVVFSNSTPPPSPHFDCGVATPSLLGIKL